MHGPLLLQIKNFLLATVGLAVVFGVPVIIIRAFNTTEKVRKKR